MFSGVGDTRVGEGARNQREEKIRSKHWGLAAGGWKRRVLMQVNGFSIKRARSIIEKIGGAKIPCREWRYGLELTPTRVGGDDLQKRRTA